MNECDRWEEWIGAERAQAEGDRERHLTVCESCREQWSAHLTLNGLAEVPLPPLSRDLGPVLGHAIAADPAADSLLSPSQRLAMRLYWLAATFVAGLLLSRLGPASTAWAFLALFAAALGLAVMPALLVLRRRLSWGLMDLVVWTLR